MTTPNLQTPDHGTDFLASGALIILNARAWTGKCKLPSSTLIGDKSVDPAFVGAHKKLVDGEAIKQITSIGQAARLWLYERSLPFDVTGAVFVPARLVPDVDHKLEEFRDRYEEEVDLFCARFGELREQAREALGELFSETDYPTDVRKRFSFDWKFVTLAPAGKTQLLDPAIVHREQLRFEESMRDARETAVSALRSRFAALVDHAAERLIDSADGKPKTFRDTLVENWRDFLSIFDALNVTDDRQLAGLVSRCREVLDGADPKTLRENADVRSQVAATMAQVSAKLDEMIVDRPGHKIRLGAVGAPRIAPAQAQAEAA